MMNDFVIDWNWFFAAFSQCGAALIGILAAFIISKLITESEKEGNNSNNLDNLLIDYNDLKKRIDSRYFNWHDEMIIKHSQNLVDSIRNGDFNSLTNKKKLIKLFEIENNLFGTKKCLENLNEQIQKLSQSTSRLEAPLNEFYRLEKIPKNIWKELSEEREIINNLKIKSEILIEQFLLLKRSSGISRIKPIKIVLLILIFGFIATVAYPLHFLPIPENEIPIINFNFVNIISFIISLKGILIIFMTIFVESILVYFLFLIRKLKKNYKILDTKIKKKHLSIDEYSKYF